MTIALEPQWCMPRMNQPRGAFLLDIFHALPCRADRRCVTGGQQDAGHDLKDEHEQQQTAERGGPSRSALDWLKQHALSQFPPTRAGTEETRPGKRLCLLLGSIRHCGAFYCEAFPGRLYSCTVIRSCSPVRKSCQRTHRCPWLIWDSKASIARGDGPLTQLPALLKMLP